MPTAQTIISRSTPSTPTTPASQTLSKPVLSSSPGTWRHPKFDEITRRQRQSAFDDGNVRRVLYNGLALAVLTYAYFHDTVNILLSSSTYIRQYSGPTLSLITLLLLYNITTALLPLYRTKDELTDIPLTPTQRSLLGLDPNVVTAATPTTTSQHRSPPGTTYITPPRYPRSPASVGSVASSGSGPASERSARSTPNVSSTQVTDRAKYYSPVASFRRGSTSGQSPLHDSPSPSPLYQKTRAMEKIRRRNSMHGAMSGSPLARAAAGAAVGTGSAPSTPNGKPLSIASPPPGGFAARGGMTGTPASVGLNSKWLYERGRSSSSSSPLSIARNEY